MEKDFINLKMTLSIPTADLKKLLESIHSESKFRLNEEKNIVNTNNNIELLNISEVAKKLKVNKNTVYNLIKSRHLSALKLGSLKVTSFELERFILSSVGKDFTDLNNVKDLNYNE